MVESFSSFSCSFWRSNRPSMRGILMSATTMSTSRLAFSAAKASTPSPANRKLTAPSRIWCRNFCWMSACQVRFVVDNQDSCCHAVRSTRVSISLRSVPKSIGLVSRASAPRSSAWRFVSASP